MTELHTGELTLPAPFSVLPVNRNFRVSASRFAEAGRARIKLIVLLGVLAATAVLPWLFVSTRRGLEFVHWMSIVLGSLTLIAAIVTWGIRLSARWWLDDEDTVIRVTNDEIVIRGSIRIPTHTVVGIWGYRRQDRRRPLSIKHLLSSHGASTSSITILVSTMAPITDPHHRVRRFTKDEEVAGRIEIPVGAYLDHDGALEDLVETFAAVITPGRPTMILDQPSEYSLAWSGYPSQISLVTRA